MNIYLLGQNFRNGYDTYDSCVVCAENEEQAKNIHPSGKPLNKDSNWAGDWVDKPEHVSCILIGTATKEQEPGVICASFNAG